MSARYSLIFNCVLLVALMYVAGLPVTYSLIGFAGAMISLAMTWIWTIPRNLPECVEMSHINEGRRTQLRSGVAVSYGNPSQLG